MVAFTFGQTFEGNRSLARRVTEESGVLAQNICPFLSFGLNVFNKFIGGLNRGEGQF